MDTLLQFFLLYTIYYGTRNVECHEMRMSLEASNNKNKFVRGPPSESPRFLKIVLMVQGFILMLLIKYSIM